MYLDGHSNKHTKKPTDGLMICRYGGRVALSRADVAKSKNIFGLKKTDQSAGALVWLDVSSCSGSGSS